MVEYLVHKYIVYSVSLGMQLVYNMGYIRFVFGTTLPFRWKLKLLNQADFVL